MTIVYQSFMWATFANLTLIKSIPQHLERIHLPHPFDVVLVEAEQVGEQARAFRTGGGDAGQLGALGVQQAEQEFGAGFVEVIRMAGMTGDELAFFQIKERSFGAVFAGGQETQVGRQLQHEVVVQVGNRPGGGIEKFKGGVEKVEQSRVFFGFADGVAGHLQHEQADGAPEHVEGQLGIDVGGADFLESGQVFTVALVGDEIHQVHRLHEAGRRPASRLPYPTDDVFTDAFRLRKHLQDEAGVAVFGGAEDQASGFDEHAGCGLRVAKLRVVAKLTPFIP